MQQSMTMLLDEDFTGGVECDGRWQVLTGLGAVLDDGVVQTTPTGISVSPPGRNPHTSEPAFTKNLTGPMCHLKWLMTTSEEFPTGGGELRVTYRASARSFGLAAHPFGNAVRDPDSDMRLGAATLNVLDFRSGMVLDFWITNTAVYALYERLQQPGEQFPEAFGQLQGPFPRTPGQVQDFCIAIDVAAGSVRWEIDGTTVARVDRIGPSDPVWWTCYHHGGAPQDAKPEQFQVAMGLLTLLDAAWPPDEKGLVDLGSSLLSPTQFHGGPPLFGQGVTLDVERLTVQTST